jgi:hypothetical protein
MAGRRRTGGQTRCIGIGRCAADAIKLEVVVRGLHGLGQVVGTQTLVRGARNPQRAVRGDDVQARTLCSIETEESQQWDPRSKQNER